MRRAVWALIVLLVGSAAEARRAEADFRVCNVTPFLLDTAFGYKDPRYGWASQGWWHVEPGACRVLINGPLRQRHLYLYGTGTREHSNVRFTGRTPFCIQPQKFTLYQSRYGANKQVDCAAAGLTSANFIEIDTQGKANWSQRLTYNGGAQAAGPTAPSGFVPRPAPGYVPPPPAPAPASGGSGGGTACQRFPNLC